MKILQQKVQVKKGARIHVKFSRPATIYLMTEVNFKRYMEGRSFRRMGGEYTKSPAEFTAPYDGTWHAVIEKGAYKNPEPMEGSIEKLPPKRKEEVYFDPDIEQKKDQKDEFYPISDDDMKTDVESEEELEGGSEEMTDETAEEPGEDVEEKSKYDGEGEESKDDEEKETY